MSKKTVKYRTVGGQVVTWNHRPNVNKLDDYGKWECSGCGDQDDGYRFEADKHAQNCRAI
ncbi:hypothetical protein ACFOWE_23010 [Planomonospora corallina]|uniref:HNH endonuclease n=1 Tax=Planomonospora corallina TaxID=1806052 RepID=A0ABV8IDR1_9ACTN